MKAVLMSGLGGIEFLHVAEHPDPERKEDELLVRVRATALNRADLLQRRGKHSPPKGVPNILGLEMAGEVASVGPACEGWAPGDRVCALLPGAGYAELVAIPADLAMRIPENLTFEEAAAIPEVFLTAYQNLFNVARLAPGETVLIHAGASGVGTAAIQLVREAGGTSLVTAGSGEKIDRCVALGARDGWNYKDGPFAPWVAERTEGRGVAIVLDFVGGPYFEQNLQSLAIDGRMVVIGTLGGAGVEKFSLRTLMSKRLQLTGAGLRSMDNARKIRLTGHFATFALPRFADGRLIPIVDSVFDWKDVGDAHLRMESNANVGKIVLRVTG
ncbi:MAG: NADPH:quinone oxidoreductase [Deltaproteobacteria bacterium CG2_30_66_27]|nr:MAG: NADPH:quinone oxidoreductase [Deltaproteobacteria bacterium CG2_30_66_27]PJB32635.1 MAG: NADPH:quinone oxidoreductase [Deltaproteobacteria bacterium CG_4_9_14_3_um_filter_65_9]